jgi:bacteriocin biosynthesis cyclodehydratase domain-containing protein
LRWGLQPLWRDRETVQVGIDARRAVAISGMHGAADVIRLLDGSRTRGALVAEATSRGVPPPVTERIITMLAAGGAIVDFQADAMRSMPCELRSELRPTLAVASLASRDGDGGVRLLGRRAATTVQVRGRGRLVDLVAELLTRAGIAASVRAGDRSGREPETDLVVLIGHPQPEQVAELQQQKVVHLAVCVREAIGVVGPLVQPGQTACLRCLDLARADRDPAWPLILAQLPAGRMDLTAGDAVLATAVAAQAAAQAVAFADRSELAAATTNGTLELALPSWQWRRRTWPPHEACTCGGWASAAGGRSAASGQAAPAATRPEADGNGTRSRDDRPEGSPE